MGRACRPAAGAATVFLLCLALLMPAFVTAAEAALEARAAAADRAIDTDALDAFVDGVWLSQRAEHRVAGAVVTVVQHGEVLLNRGLGYADIAARRPVDPERTLFRIASISKPFTWVALMQLVEQGRLDLDAEVNGYFDRVQIPEPFGQPVTALHFMNHSAGFEDLVLDLGRRSADDLEPLEDYLASNLPRQVRPPGQYSSYSNHSTALAAHLIARVSGEPWSDYLEQQVLAPLGMTRTVVRHPMPEALRADLAQGYQYKAGAFEPQPFIHWRIYPAGMVSTTGADMARFMTALLDEGRGLMSPATHRRMLEVSYRPFPGARGWRHGFNDLTRRGVVIYGHGGDYRGFHSQMVLIPQLSLGVFLSFNSDGGDRPAGNLQEALLDWLIGDDLPPRAEPPPDAGQRQAQYAGVYAPLRRPQSDFSKLARLLGGTRVWSDDDGYLLIDGGNGATAYVATATPDRFRGRYSDTEVLFHRDADDAVTHLTFSSYAASTMERLGTIDRPRLHQALFALVALSMLVCVIGWAVGLIRRRGLPPRPLGTRVLNGLSWLAALGVLWGIVKLVQGLQDNDRFLFEIPPEILRTLTVSTLVVGVGLLLAAIRVWRLTDGTAGWGERLMTLVFVVGFVLYAWLSWYWNTLGWF
ncbi:MAG: serine hydrolase domain-containing protein [Pseudomonadota bacterium]